MGKENWLSGTDDWKWQIGWDGDELPEVIGRGNDILIKLREEYREHIQTEHNQEIIDKNLVTPKTCHNCIKYNCRIRELEMTITSFQTILHNRPKS